jgi:hypothetical protein
MPRYHTTVHSSLSAEAAFLYMADFSNAAVWDPGITSAERVGTGPVTLGSRFILQATFGKSTMPLEYVLAAYEPHQRLLLCAETEKVKSIDEIIISPTTTGCDVTYRAELITLGSFRWATPIVALLFKKIGDKARDGLRRELNP